ncbi:hypothetical protein FB451DRAFT_1169019 [Mycena latifolia]|nr:hypothetical protein FB451DRAFT_1169019 [Mycena latifolia]
MNKLSILFITLIARGVAGAVSGLPQQTVAVISSASGLAPPVDPGTATTAGNLLCAGGAVIVSNDIMPRPIDASFSGVNLLFIDAIEDLSGDTLYTIKCEDKGTMKLITVPNPPKPVHLSHPVHPERINCAQGDVAKAVAQSRKGLNTEVNTGYKFSITPLEIFQVTNLGRIILTYSFCVLNTTTCLVNNPTSGTVGLDTLDSTNSDHKWTMDFYPITPDIGPAATEKAIKDTANAIDAVLDTAAKADPQAAEDAEGQGGATNPDGATADDS